MYANRFCNNVETFIIRERSRVIFMNFRIVHVFIVMTDYCINTYYTDSRGQLSMAERHISFLKPFSSGDDKDWFQQFEICARANGWEALRREPDSQH